MLDINKDRCQEFGLDPKKVKLIARRLSAAAKDAQALGLTVFSHVNGTGFLRVSSVCGEHGDIAELDGHFDGGDS
jgi:hypothetical protein